MQVRSCQESRFRIQIHYGSREKPIIKEFGAIGPQIHDAADIYIENYRITHDVDESMVSGFYFYLRLFAEAYEDVAAFLDWLWPWS